MSRRVRRDVAAEGIVFKSVDGQHPFFLDPVPQVFTEPEWSKLERGLAQRCAR